MLYIETTIAETSWLNYLLEEFCRIEKTEFKFEITSAPPKGSNIVKYDQNIGDIHLAQNKGTADSLQFIDENVFILNGTQDASFKGEFNYDLLWNAFYFLSRKDEWDLEQKGVSIQSYSGKTSRINKESWSIPIVNSYFKILKGFISRKFDNLQFEEQSEPILELSHDLDYIKKTNSLRIKQSVFNFLNGIKNLDTKKLKKAAKFAFSKQDYWNFDYWTKIEKSYHLKSTFYVYSKVKKSGPRKWLLDPGYGIKTNIKLQEKLKSLLNEGWQIGLHGSFDSAENLELLQAEKENLEKALSHKITKTRQHWLRYTENKTAKFHEQLFEQDSTIGWNDRIGFRAGIASKYRPYNHKDRCAFKHFVVPQIIMDSNIFDYGFKNETELIQQSIAMLQRCKTISNAHFSISWHPRTCNEEYNWHKAYEKLLATW